MTRKHTLGTLQEESRERHGFIEENPFQYLVKRRLVIKGSGWKPFKEKGKVIDWTKIRKAAIAR